MNFAYRGRSTERTSGPIDQHVEYRNDQGYRACHHGPNGEPLQALPIVTDRVGVAQPGRDQRAERGCSAQRISTSYAKCWAAPRDRRVRAVVRASKLS